MQKLKNYRQFELFLVASGMSRPPMHNSNSAKEEVRGN